MASQTQYGGHDHDFVSKNLDKLICTVCTKVVRDPHLTACCGQHFCSSCLTQWFTKTKKESCPHCRAEGSDFQHIPDKKTKREVGELQIRCSNKDGCEWVGSLVGLKKHLESDDGCGFVKVACPNKCKNMLNFLFSRSVRLIQRKNLEKHLTNECPRRPYQCVYCGDKDEYKKIMSHIDRNCPEKPLNCCNKCGSKPIKRKDIEDHYMMCPLEQVLCPFNKAGCKERIARKDLDEHVASNTQQHLLLTFKWTEKVQLEADARVEKHQREIDSKMESLEKEVNFLKQTDFCKETVKTSLACISTHLQPKRNDKVFRISNFQSHYVCHDKIWQSPPFECSSNRQLSLHVHPTGKKSDQGSHVSLSIVLGRVGEDTSLDASLYTLAYLATVAVTIKLLDQLQPSPQQASVEWKTEIEFTRLTPSKTLCVNEQFVPIENLSRFLLNDSLVFSITLSQTLHFPGLGLLTQSLIDIFN